MTPELAGAPPLEALLDQIPALLTRALPEAWPELAEVVAQAFPTPLPRLIAIPVACAMACHAHAPAAVPAAAAWAALNLSLRILDDLQDQDRPDGLWSTVGADRAFLYAAALREVASSLLATAAEAPAQARLQALADVSRTLLRVGRGQERDLRGTEDDVKGLWAVIQDKSGELFALACRLGCELAGADAAATAALSRYGFHLGIALQLLDDLASVLPAEQYRDLRHGRTRFPLHMALTLAGPGSELAALTSAPPPWPVERISELIRSHGAGELTLWTARQERDRALEALHGLGDPGAAFLAQLCRAPFPADPA